MEEKSIMCHQYKIREIKKVEEKEQFTFLEQKANLKNTIIKRLNKSDIGNIIYEYEWLKTIPPFNKFIFGIYFIVDEKEYLGGVIIYSEEYSNNTKAWDKYTFKSKLLLLSRGVCIWWTPKNTASYFISKTFEYLKKNTNYECITATVDPLAGEVGIIYQSLNFHYVGLMDGNYDKNGNEFKRLKIIINGKELSAKTVRKKLGTVKKDVVLEKYPDAKFIYEYRKRRYFYFIKNKKIHKKSLSTLIKPYPKKGDLYELLRNTNGIIYKITNKVNGKVYIGQTTKRLEERISNYKTDLTRANTYLNNAFKKYGFDKFLFEIIEQCDTVFILNEREIYYIALYESTNKNIGYNLQTGGQNKGTTQETRDKMSLAKKGTVQTQEWINKRIRRGKEHHCFGNKHTEEYKKDLSDKMKTIKSDLKNVPRDNDITQRMTKTKIDKYGKKVEQFNRITGESIEIFDSIGQAVKITKVTFGTITSHCNLKVRRYVNDISWRWYSNI